MTVFINIDLVFINFRDFFLEVTITLGLFIGYETQISQKNLILVQKVPFSIIDRFDLLDFSRNT